MMAADFLTVAAFQRMTGIATGRTLPALKSNTLTLIQTRINIIDSHTKLAASGVKELESLFTSISALLDFKCLAAHFVHLREKKFYDGHREKQTARNKAESSAR